MSRSKCRGEGVDPPDLNNTWTILQCQDVYQSLLFKDDGSYNPSNIPSVQSDFDILFNKYISQFSIAPRGSSDYNVFQDTLREACKVLPGACDSFLGTFCRGRSREDISKDQGLLHYCGCRSPDLTDQVKTLTKIRNKACDPLCFRGDVIQENVNTKTGVIPTCEDDLCVISNISISAELSDSKREPTIKQICNNCRTGQCICVASGDISDLSRKFDIQQFCGKNAICIQTTDPSVPGKVVPCVQDEETLIQGIVRYWWIGVILLVIVVLIFTVALTQR